MPGEAKAKGVSAGGGIGLQPDCVFRSGAGGADIAQSGLANAVRYTDHGRIVMGCRRRGGEVAIQVWDTGRGIPRRISRSGWFQEYYQLANPERDRAKGLGLGLAIVRR